MGDGKEKQCYMIQNGGDPEAWLTSIEDSRVVNMNALELDDHWKKRKRKKKEDKAPMIRTYVYQRGHGNAIRFTDLWEAWQMASKLHVVVWVVEKLGPHHIATEEEILKARKAARERERKAESGGIDGD